MNKELQNTWDCLVNCSKAGCGSMFIGGDAAIIAADKLMREQQEVNVALLKVCKDLIEAQPYVSEYDVPLGLWDDIKAAIVKAEGGV